MLEKDNSLITRFSKFFITNFRVTILLFLSIVLLGAASYTTFLQREGFPPVEFPVGVVTVPYFVGDAKTVNNEVTKPVESSISDVEEIQEVRSSTSDNFAMFQIEFKKGTTSEEGIDLVKQELTLEASLPDNVEPNYLAIDAGTVDGENDLLFTVSADRPIKEIQEKASFIANEINDNPDIVSAEVQELISLQTNPQTGENIDYQSDYNRVVYRENGELISHNAVAIGVTKKDNVGIIDFSDELRDEIDKLKEEGSLDGYNVEYGGDISVYVRDQINSLESNALSGFLVVILVLFFLVNWRASIVTALFIPTVLAATFIALFATGVTLNTITLFSLILVLGLFVDDAIVVVEAIDYQKKHGKKGVKAVMAAINSIGVADVSGTITTIFVFAPLLFITGVLGDFIRLIPITVIIALALSLLIALSIIPYLSNLIISPSNGGGEKDGWRRYLDIFLYGVPRFVSRLGENVSGFVRFYLSNKIYAFVVLTITTLLIVVGGYFASQLEFSVFPTPKDANEMAVNVTYPPGTSVQEAEQKVIEVENVIKNELDEDLESINYYSGDASSASLNVLLSDMDERDPSAIDFKGALENEFKDLEGVSAKVSISSAGPPEENYQFSMQVFAQDPETLEKVTSDIRDYVQELGLSEGEVIEAVVLRLDEIAKIDGKRYAQVSAKVSDPDNTAISLEIRDQIQSEFDAERLEGYGLDEEALSFDFGQESDNIDSFNSTLFFQAVSLLLMYALLVFQYNSFSQPLLIFMAIPLSFPGLFPGLYFTNNPMSFFVLLGITGLIGIVVNNTIMLVDFANQARAEGKGIVDSISEAVSIRFRPLVTTSITTIAGVLPLAIAEPFWEPLVLSIVFGLMASTTLVILVFPLFYALVEKARMIVRRQVRKLVKS